MNYFIDQDGIYRPHSPVYHRDDEYEQTGFDVLWEMQKKHFWYRGRHRFLLAALDRTLPFGSPHRTCADLGGGVGGWMSYLINHRSNMFSKMALADSSVTALRMAGSILPNWVERYQIDLMNLCWHDKWDCIFLLDVIEHLPDDKQALRQAMHALKPGGYLFITAPALKKFWSYNDELVHHLRRYERQDFINIAQNLGLQLCEARYFMFLLSPLYWLARKGIDINHMNEEEKALLIKKTHKVPPRFLNSTLSAVFAAETPLGHLLHFPWGTSILGVLRKP